MTFKVKGLISEGNGKWMLTPDIEFPNKKTAVFLAGYLQVQMQERKVK